MTGRIFMKFGMGVMPLVPCLNSDILISVIVLDVIACDDAIVI
jgi:hypothetical protein